MSGTFGADVADNEDADADTTAATRRRRGLRDWIVVIIVALLASFVMRTYVLANFVVSGHSMDTTLDSGDRVLVNKLSYRLHAPNRGDVVVLHGSTGAVDRDLIKRVIALESETIEIRNCEVRIDGAVLEEPYLDAVEAGDCGGDVAPVLVPDGHVFVMGDNRCCSSDSRSPQLGPVDIDDIVGRAFVVIWPIGHWRWL